MSNDPSPEQLADIQKTHLDFLETYFAGVLVAGVPILQCLGYKLIQIMNNTGLKSMLENGEDDAESVNIE